MIKIPSLPNQTVQEASAAQALEAQKLNPGMIPNMAEGVGKGIQSVAQVVSDEAARISKYRIEEAAINMRASAAQQMGEFAKLDGKAALQSSDGADLSVSPAGTDPSLAFRKAHQDYSEKILDQLTPTQREQARLIYLQTAAQLDQGIASHQDKAQKQYEMSVAKSSLDQNTQFALAASNDPTQWRSLSSAMRQDVARLNPGLDSTGIQEAAVSKTALEAVKVAVANGTAVQDNMGHLLESMTVADKATANEILKTNSSLSLAYGKADEYVAKIGTTDGKGHVITEEEAYASMMRDKTLLNNPHAHAAAKTAWGERYAIHDQVKKQDEERLRIDAMTYFNANNNDPWKAWKYVHSTITPINPIVGQQLQDYFTGKQDHARSLSERPTPAQDAYYWSLVDRWTKNPQELAQMTPSQVSMLAPKIGFSRENEIQAMRQRILNPGPTEPVAVMPREQLQEQVYSVWQKAGLMGSKPNDEQKAKASQFIEYLQRTQQNSGRKWDMDSSMKLIQDRSRIIVTNPGFFSDDKAQAWEIEGQVPAWFTGQANANGISTTDATDKFFKLKRAGAFDVPPEVAFEQVEAGKKEGVVITPEMVQRWWFNKFHASNAGMPVLQAQPQQQSGPYKQPKTVIPGKGGRK